MTCDDRPRLVTRRDSAHTTAVRCAPPTTGTTRRDGQDAVRSTHGESGDRADRGSERSVTHRLRRDSSEQEPPPEDAETAPEDGGDAAEEDADEGGESGDGGDGSIQEADWSTTPREHRGQDGSEFVYDCPADGDEDSAGPLWGDELYTDDSAVCLAAVHAGEITFEDGGTVTIVIEPGEDSYESTESNGVESSSWGSWSGSYRFVAGGGWIAD
ncbi:hypothetical protein J4H86_09955 [Spiractinospora alimapuensis]|uniref:LCCL domain-containing protein n=1 Tax=Spiractinospora alimapuensis TaxID=2820884 RepID=UPI001EFEF64E|nr:LCCL domain-containing protein [Spiractinospora alimapuensis]QVQ53994.1 hypothetical protein J4H86_09955 [Spiractinospora alimapuensis]